MPACALGVAFPISMIASNRLKASICLRRSGVSQSSGTSAAASLSGVQSR